MAVFRAGAAGGEKRPLFQWWHGLIVGLLLAYAPGSLLVMLMLLLPLLFLRLFDPDADRQRLMVVMFYVGAVMVHPLREAWRSAGDWQTCLELVLQPLTLLLDWMAVGAAWLVAEGSSIGTRLWYADVARRERRAIEKRIAVLRKEWSVPDDTSGAS
ncbi:hypothetical protein [Gluconobacter morbifer]|uniref:Transmembrane protein n=1 Tax=Gluconobacter morbifer G707 TaxID=1088869 RepID=G6XMP0_9PROT|nr:hypothetical protein [Gluconobacter morbifer]EHH66939.1 hypothetical protein GMO_27580 [Gluconobacter morbifer G707]